MKASAIPTKFAEPFAKNAGASYIRTIPITTADPNAASLDLGFPSNTFVSTGAGGAPPDGRDFNGILNMSTSWDQWFSAGGPVYYDATFSGQIGGYPKGAVLSRSGVIGNFWISTVDDNTSNPDSGGANWNLINPRIQLSANTTFYVATTGSDSTGNGTSGNPWLTIQKALNVLASSYDLQGFTAIIQLADGTYTGANTQVGGFLNGTVTIQGNIATPANTVVSTTAADGFSLSLGAAITFQYLKIQTASSGNCIHASSESIATIGAGVTFGACAGAHMFAELGGLFLIAGAYFITGSSAYHCYTESGAQVSNAGGSCTLTGTPAFSASFATANNTSAQLWGGFVFTGAATGVRYSSTLNSVLNTAGGGANFFPGNSAGSTATGGQYT